MTLDSNTIGLSRRRAAERFGINCAKGRGTRRFAPANGETSGEPGFALSARNKRPL
jgi:hypothetical protein